jgi:hypothetical protein
MIAHETPHCGFDVEFELLLCGQAREIDLTLRGRSRIHGIAEGGGVLIVFRNSLLKRCTLL